MKKRSDIELLPPLRKRHDYVHGLRLATRSVILAATCAVAMVGHGADAATIYCDGTDTSGKNTASWSYSFHATTSDPLAVRGANDIDDQRKQLPCVVVASDSNDSAAIAVLRGGPGVASSVPVVSEVGGLTPGAGIDPGPAPGTTGIVNTNTLSLTNSARLSILGDVPVNNLNHIVLGSQPFASVNNANYNGSTGLFGGVPTGGNDIALVAIPEPMMIFSLFTGILILASRRGGRPRSVEKLVLTRTAGFSGTPC